MTTSYCPGVGREPCRAGSSGGPARLRDGRSVCGTCERRGASNPASVASAGAAQDAAAQAAAAADGPGDSALSPSAQRTNAALDRLLTGRLSDDAADQRNISTDEALASLGEVVQGRYLDDGLPMAVGHEVTFGGGEWYRRQTEAGVAPWDDIHAVARQWLQKPHPEMSSKIIGRTAEAFKYTSEHAANYIKQAESLRNGWA